MVTGPIAKSVSKGILKSIGTRGRKTIGGVKVKKIPEGKRGISKKEMQIDYKYSKYMTDEGFVVYHRGTDKVDKQQTQRLYQQYYQEQMALNKQIESYQSAHGRYASKYDLKSYDPQEMQKREYRAM